MPFPQSDWLDCTMCLVNKPIKKLDSGNLMTVKELIAELSKWPLEIRVVVSGYEDGYDDISRIKSITIKPQTKPNPWEGRWEDDRTGEPAILLFGRGRDGG